MMFAMEKGVSLIEASAGTGKTYTLCRIVLRLVVEKGIPIDRILAITFTQAATEELVARIRELLHEAASQLQSGEIEETILKEILARESIDKDVARNRLRHSLEIFDDASISTIHGFCKRSLEFVSLESDLPFDANLEPVDDELIARLQDEYIRINILEKSALLSAYFTKKSTYREQLKIIAKECASHPYARIEPTPVQVPVEAVESAFQSFLDAIEPFLSTADTLTPHLKGNTRLYKLVSNPDALAALQAVASRRLLLLSDLQLPNDLTSDTWKKAVRKASEHLEPPPIAKFADRLTNEIDQAFSSLVANYRDWLFENLRSEKERRNVVSFNDLLHVLNRALDSSQGEAVAEAIGQQFDAALVDEFQDTDPTQYNIIQRLFGDGQKYLFFIGDPKQAIYRFRGADIFSYFQATESQATQRIQLSDNYRSHPKLVHAVNLLFQSSPDGFAFDRIQFSPANPVKSPAVDLPLQIEAFGLSKSVPLNQSESTNRFAALAVEDLAQRKKEEPDLDLGKVAFLVSTNKEADALMRELSLRGIDGLLRAERSVFESDEMGSMLQLLETLSNPSRASAVRALLLTPICGYTWSDLCDNEFEERSETIISYLHDWSRNWPSTNFDAAFHRLLKISGAAKRMLGALGGERQYANLSQLSELLQSEALSRLSTPRHLFAWLHGKRDEKVSTQEDWQTRLTSDRGKPQIVTIHKSKGLQFPIVICPFLTQLQPYEKRDYALYHRSQGSENLVLDLAPETGSEAMEQAEREEYAEHLRLIYVALTRAVEECRIYLGPEENAPRARNQRPSSFCQLVLGSENAIRLQSENRTSQALLNRIQEFDPATIAVVERSLGVSDSIPQTQVLSTRQLGATPTARAIDHDSIPVSERILSFSTITRMVHAHDAETEEIENDETELSPSPDPVTVTEEDVDSADAGPSIFSLPKGAHTGNLLHEILETLDFTQPETIAECVHQAFHQLRYGYAEYKPVVSALIQTLVAKPLADGLSLDAVRAEKRIPEMEFAYPTSSNTLRRIQRAFVDHPSPGIPQDWVEGLRLSQTSVGASFLRGFIDLVFEHNGQLFIVDWKSNHLGNRVEDYGRNSLSAAMSQHDYFLQYCLYGVALKRFLETRRPQTDFYDHFGGVYYLFLRGISPSDDNGIFFDRPSRELLDALDRAIGK